jgi:hypothetical protein
MRFQEKLNKLNVEMALDEIRESHGDEIDAQVDRLMGIVAKQKQKVDARKPIRVAPSGYMDRTSAFRYRRHNAATVVRRLRKDRPKGGLKA